MWSTARGSRSRPVRRLASASHRRQGSLDARIPGRRLSSPTGDLRHSLGILIRPRDASAVSVPFLPCLGKTPSFTPHTYSRVSGTTVLCLAKDAVPSYTFPGAPRGILDAFNSLVESVFGRLIDFSPDSERSRNVRDTLLSRLASGEVRVGLP